MPIQGIVVLASDALARELVRRISREGFPEIRPAHARAVGFLPPEGARLTELAQRAQMTKQAMAELVDELVDAGYMSKEPDPNDGRAKIIKFTSKGLRAARTGKRLYDDMERDLGRMLGPKVMASVRRALSRIATQAFSEEEG